MIELDGLDGPRRADGGGRAGHHARGGGEAERKPADAALHAFGVLLELDVQVGLVEAVVHRHAAERLD